MSLFRPELTLRSDHPPALAIEQERVSELRAATAGVTAGLEVAEERLGVADSNIRPEAEVLPVLLVVSSVKTQFGSCLIHLPNQSADGVNGAPTH
jgi:hypothetical protein